jgi:uncharacterized protein YpiB (UPF0302 family)
MQKDRQDKIAALEKKRDQINARIQKEKSRQNAKKRKSETQLKILLGAAMLKKLARLETGDKRDELLEYIKKDLAPRDQGRFRDLLQQLQ